MIEATCEKFLPLDLGPVALSRRLERNDHKTRGPGAEGATPSHRVRGGAARVGG